MAITKRGNSYQVSIVLGGKRYRRSFKEYVEAEIWEGEAKVRHKKGLPVLTGTEEKIEQEKSTITWRKLADLVYDQRWKHQKSAVSHKINSDDVVEILGSNKKVSDVKQSDIDRIATYLQTENPDISVSTINRKYSSLSVLIKYAQKRGYITKMFDIPKFKEPEHRIRWISKEEEGFILMYFRGKPIVSDIITVLVDTGLRCSELWRLKVHDVTDTHLTVWVSKGGKPRTIPLTKRAREVLKKHTKGRDKEEQVFKDWNNWKLTHYWGKVRSALRLEEDPQFVPHILRHTFCTRLVQNGVPLSHVQKLAGHSDISTTLRYAHLSQEDLDKAILVLEQSESVSQNVSEMSICGVTR